MEDKQVKFQSFDNNLNQDDYNYLKDLDNKYLNNFDINDNTTHLTEKDYANLQHNLILFKQGDREATEYIIKAFHRILHTYTHFIVLHKLPYQKITNYKNGQTRTVVNQSIANFIRLFSKKTKENRGNSQMFKDTCEYIYSLFSKYEYGDIYNELSLALLNMANKYKIITDKNDPKYKPNGTFHVYVKKCFHFEAFHSLKRLANDPLLSANLLSTNEEDYIDNYDEDKDCIPNKIMIDEKTLFEYETVIDCIDRQNAIQNSNLVTLKEDNIDIYSDDSLNFNWINGAVCGPIFKSLTSYERELLILSYTKNQTEDTLASLFGCSRSTIGSHKRKAIKKIKEAMNKNEDK